MSLDITHTALPERKRILVVEDLEALRRLYTITLSAHFEVDEASSAIIALEKIVNDRPLAVILDIRMPGRMSGLDLCRHIKTSDNFRDIKVVIVTGSDQSFDREAGIQLGADAFFQKPLSPSVLLGCLLSLTEPL